MQDTSIIRAPLPASRNVLGPYFLSSKINNNFCCQSRYGQGYWRYILFLLHNRHSTEFGNYYLISGLVYLYGTEQKFGNRNSKWVLLYLVTKRKVWLNGITEKTMTPQFFPFLEQANSVPPGRSLNRARFRLQQYCSSTPIRKRTRRGWRSLSARCITAQSVT